MVLVAARHVVPDTCTPEASKHDFSNETKIKEKQNKTIPDLNSNLTNDSSQSNQGTEHLISHFQCNNGYL
jgi:hypothetical protein